MNCYIIKEQNIGCFEWTKSLILYITSCAKKYNMTIQELCLNQLPQTGFLFVIGVNDNWLCEVAKAVSDTQLIIIQFLGENCFENNRTVFIEETASSVFQNINYLKSRNRNRIAFFGVQANDTSDMKKAKAFASKFCVEDVYIIKNDIYDTFKQFFQNISRYDSVICSNDLIGVYLLKMLKKLNIKVPKQLYVTGTGNLWISSHIHPSLTSVYYDMKTTADAVFSLLKKERFFDSVSHITLNPKINLIPRAATGEKTQKSEIPYKPVIQKDYQQEIEPALCQIKNLDSTLSAFSKTDITILKLMYDNISSNEIAEKIYLSTDSVKYHIKKIYKYLNVHNREELKKLLDENLIDTNCL